MKLEVTWRNEQVILTVSGSLTMDNAGRLTAQLRASVIPPCRICVIDMSGLTQLDSSGVGALATGVDICREKNVALRIAGISGRVLQTIQVAKADRFLNMFPDVESALAAP
jgi:anti-anti-sigma factor